MEQPLPPNGCCNLGSLDVSKFLTQNKEIDYEKLAYAVQLSVRFLDKVIDVNSYPTEGIKQWANENRPVGLGIMGLADLFLEMGIAYGSDKALNLTAKLMSFIQQVATDESVILGNELGVPVACTYLPQPRRNITVLSIAPTGTISLLAGCSNGIEPVFSELTQRTDNTGTYMMEHAKANESYFRCAVSTNGGQEVTWKEHVLMQDIVQRWVDSGVSKTINFPNHTSRKTIYDAFMLAWKSEIKGITVYRNGSRQIEVLQPKNIKKDLCPFCDSELIHEAGCVKCSNQSCEFSMCEIS